MIIQEKIQKKAEGFGKLASGCQFPNHQKNRRLDYGKINKH